MKQLSLVAFYGSKPRSLDRVLDRCISLVAEGPLGDRFRPYARPQIHATIVGMESLPGEPGVNRNLWEKRREKARMRFSPLVGILRRGLPMTIRFGGFAPDDRRFDSHGRTPYERTIQVDRASGKVAMIGWPHRNGRFDSRVLEELRGELARSCHLEHKYDRDNDLYLVLGTLQRPAVADCACAVETAIREDLRLHSIDLSMDLGHLSVVCYEDERLDPATTRSHSVIETSLTDEVIEGMYGA